MRFGRIWPILSTLYLCQLRKSYRYEKYDDLVEAWVVNSGISSLPRRGGGWNGCCQARDKGRTGRPSDKPHPFWIRPFTYSISHTTFLSDCDTPALPFAYCHCCHTYLYINSFIYFHAYAYPDSLPHSNSLV
jgi:hypothetical protein